MPYVSSLRRIPARLTDNAEVCWHVVHTYPRQEAAVCDLLRQHGPEIGNIAETYLPTRTVNVISGGTAKRVPLLSGHVFVHATERAVLTFLLNYYRDGYLLRDFARQQVMTVPESEMRQFMEFNATAMEEMLVLERPYYKYAANPKLIRARVNDGPFAGREGYLIHLRNERRLVFRLGDLAIAISQIWRYGLTRIRVADEDSHTDEERSPLSPRHAADRLTALLQNAGCTDDAPERLRELCRLLGETPSLAKLRSELTRRVAARSSASAAAERQMDFLHALSEKDASTLLSLAKLLRNGGADEEAVIPLRALRPFLTLPAENGLADLPPFHADGADDASQTIASLSTEHKEFTELIVPVAMEELVFDRKTGTTAPRTTVYSAHVALFTDIESVRCQEVLSTSEASTRTDMLICDWCSLYQRYALLQGAAATKQDKTFAQYCPELLDMLRDTHPGGIAFRSIRLADGKEICGPALLFPAPQEGDLNTTAPPLAAFLSPLLRLCQTIAQSTHLALWQEALRDLWLR